MQLFFTKILFYNLMLLHKTEKQPPNCPPITHTPPPSPQSPPDIDTYTGLMHTLFALEDMYGLKIGEIDGEICLRLDKSDYSTYSSMFDMFHAWQEQAAKLEQGEITKEEYDQWRYKYPELDTTKHWAKVPSQAVSDMLIEEFQKNKHKKPLPIFSFHI